MRQVRTAAALATALALSWAGPAAAWTAEVSWPTYFRAGPSRHYHVLEELDRGIRLDVLSCDGGWCQVQEGRSTGFVEQANLVQPSQVPQKPAGQPADSPNCFTSRLDGYGKDGELYRYCMEAKPPS